MHLVNKWPEVRTAVRKERGWHTSERPSARSFSAIGIGLAITQRAKAKTAAIRKKDLMFRDWLSSLLLRKGL